MLSNKSGSAPCKQCLFWSVYLGHKQVANSYTTKASQIKSITECTYCHINSKRLQTMHRNMVVTRWICSKMHKNSPSVHLEAQIQSKESFQSWKMYTYTLFLTKFLYFLTFFPYVWLFCLFQNLLTSLCPWGVTTMTLWAGFCQTSTPKPCRTEV